MRILLTGGGTGGHFYPLIAIAEQLNNAIAEQKLIDVRLYYMSDTPYDKEALLENGITFIPVWAGKNRIYASWKNIPDIFKTGMGIIRAVWRLFRLYPDVVISKGGYASFPALVAARLLRIPTVIHESDSVPGRVSLWSGKFAKRIAVSYADAAKSFPGRNVAHTGQPIREQLRMTVTEGAFEYLKLDQSVPVLFVIGGSLGSQAINDVFLDALPDLLSRYQIIHQVGAKNMQDVSTRAEVILKNNPHADRYKPFGFLNILAMKMAAGAATLVISRAGSTIFEIASWGKPSIIVPIPEAVSRDQESNAFAYARTGACTVLEEGNMTPHTLAAEIDKIASDPERLRQMAEKTKAFNRPDAAKKIADEALVIALEHQE